eukprot:1155586-Rhodomonas_salina.2
MLARSEPCCAPTRFVHEIEAARVHAPRWLRASPLQARLPISCRERWDFVSYDFTLKTTNIPTLSDLLHQQRLVLEF